MSPISNLVHINRNVAPGVRNEDIYAEAVTPGMLIQIDSTGKVEKHATAGGPALPRFALEQELLGKGPGDDIALGDNGPWLFCQGGEKLWAWLADGENVAVDDLLESAGDGTLRKHVPQAVDEGGTATFNIGLRKIVCQVVAALDNSAGGAAARVLVRAV